MFLLRKWGVIAFFTALTLCLMYCMKDVRVWGRMFTLEYEQGTGTLAIVRDIRGSDPYMTIKMKCYYDDDKKYGHHWDRLTMDGHCHEQLFKKCFKERTVAGRHETHVLTFHSSKYTNRCVCSDISGWYNHVCKNSTISIKCCPDRGVKSVQCRM